MNENEWLEANTRYLTTAVAWVRSLLVESGPRDAVASAPPTVPSGSGWRRPPKASLSAILASGNGALTAAQAAMQAAAEATTPPPALILLSQRLGLSSFEQNVLLLCVAAELDTSVAGLCARAANDPARSFPTFALALTLFDDPAWDVLSPERPLRHWKLIEISQPGGTPLTVSPLRADEHIVNFVKGITYLDDRLNTLLSPLPPTGDDIPASQRDTADLAVRQWHAIAPGGPMPAIQLLGSDPASKRVVATLICTALGRRPMRLDAALLPAAPADLEALGRLWRRETLLLPIALYLDADGTEPMQSSALERLLARLDGLVLLATRHLWPGANDAPIAVEVRKPTPAEQSACWKAALGAAAGELPDLMAAQFNLTAGTIRELVRRASVEADDGAGENASRPALHDRLWDAARVLSRSRLDTLARRLIPRAVWDDIVLPAAETALLRSIADQVGHRSKVYRDWGFAERMNRGLGISVLFAGASGTGKTMAAEILAAHLRLDLFRIDLSTVVSKYIGETEANLRRLFDAAEDGGTILFFDEADALFGKRTEVKESHDRYANIEIDYLLQRMESFGGLAILATNMKSALDQAFLRRLRFVLDFPFPGVPERRAIWQRAFPASTPTAGLDFDRLARLNITGGHVAVIALNAAFQAAQAGTSVTMPIVLNAARIEFRKLGRPINEMDFRWQKVVA
jgi:hypothetical protein